MGVNGYRTVDYLKTQVMLLFRYGEGDGSGDGCHHKDSLLFTVPKKRGHVTPHRPHRKTPGSIRRQREQGQGELMSQTVYCHFHGYRRQGRVSTLRVGSGLRGFSCLSGTWSWMMRTEDYCLLEYKSQTEEVVWFGIDPGLVCLHVKGIFTE